MSRNRSFGYSTSSIRHGCQKGTEDLGVGDPTRGTLTGTLLCRCSVSRVVEEDTKLRDLLKTRFRRSAERGRTRVEVEITKNPQTSSLSVKV